jgi:hypothetical protein
MPTPSCRKIWLKGPQPSAISSLPSDHRRRFRCCCAAASLNEQQLCSCSCWHGAEADPAAGLPAAVGVSVPTAYPLRSLAADRRGAVTNLNCSATQPMQAAASCVWPAAAAPGCLPACPLLQPPCELGVQQQQQHRGGSQAGATSAAAPPAAVSGLCGALRQGQRCAAGDVQHLLLASYSPWGLSVSAHNCRHLAGKKSGKHKTAGDSDEEQEEAADTEAEAPSFDPEPIERCAVQPASKQRHSAQRA